MHKAVALVAITLCLAALVAADTGVQKNPRISARRKHAAASPGIVFGGTTASKAKLNDFMMLASDGWKVLPVLDGAIPAVQSHTMTNINDKLYIFGGQQDTGLTNDLWYTIDGIKKADVDAAALPQLRLQKARVGDNWPLPRRRHAAVNVNGDLQIMFGLSEDRALSDVWRYTPSTGKWKKLNPTGEEPGMKRINPCCDVDEDGNTLCFGGTDPQRGDFNDVLQLNADGTKWERLAGNGDVPSKRRLAVCAYNNKKFTVTLGWDSGKSSAVQDASIYVYDVATQTWSKSGKTDAIPTIRDGTALYKDGALAFVVGGLDGKDQSLLNDVWRFTVGETKATQVQNGMALPPQGVAAKTASIGAELFAFFEDATVWKYANQVWTKLTVEGPKGIRTASKVSDTTIALGTKKDIKMFDTASITITQVDIAGATFIMPFGNGLFSYSKDLGTCMLADAEGKNGVSFQCTVADGALVAISSTQFVAIGTNAAPSKAEASVCTIDGDKKTVTCVAHTPAAGEERKYSRFGGGAALVGTNVVYCGGRVSNSFVASPSNYCFSFDAATGTFAAYSGADWNSFDNSLAVVNGTLVQYSGTYATAGVKRDSIVNTLSFW